VDADLDEVRGIVAPRVRDDHALRAERVINDARFDTLDFNGH
jgi:hypothetical protein